MFINFYYLILNRFLSEIIIKRDLCFICVVTAYLFVNFQLFLHIFILNFRVEYFDVKTLFIILLLTDLKVRIVNLKLIILSSTACIKYYVVHVFISVKSGYF